MNTNNTSQWVLIDSLGRKTNVFANDNLAMESFYTKEDAQKDKHLMLSIQKEGYQYQEASIHNWGITCKAVKTS